MALATTEVKADTATAAPPAVDAKSSWSVLISRGYGGHTEKVHSVAWNCTGKRLASGSVDMTARIWAIDQHHVSVCTETHVTLVHCFSKVKNWS